VDECKPLVLGLDKNINPRYLPSLLAMLGLPQTLGILGRALQVDPIKPTLKAPGSKRSKLNHGGPLSDLLSNSSCAATARRAPRLQPVLRRRAGR